LEILAAIDWAMFKRENPGIPLGPLNEYRQEFHAVMDGISAGDKTDCLRFAASLDLPRKNGGPAHELDVMCIRLHGRTPEDRKKAIEALLHMAKTLSCPNSRRYTPSAFFRDVCDFIALKVNNVVHFENRDSSDEILQAFGVQHAAAVSREGGFSGKSPKPPQSPDALVTRYLDFVNFRPYGYTSCTYSSWDNPQWEEFRALPTLYRSHTASSLSFSTDSSVK
jgi:hypothetical protein